MPVITATSRLRWFLPLGAAGIAIVAFAPSGEKVTGAQPTAALVTSAAATDVIAAAPVSPPTPATAPPTKTAPVAALPPAAQLPETPVISTAKAEPAPAWMDALTRRPHAEQQPAGPRWLPADWTTQVAAAKVVAAPNADVVALVARTGLNVRSGPSSNAQRLFVLQQRERVAVLGTSDGWTKVRTESGAEGWAYTPLLADPSEPIADAPPRREVIASVSGGEVTYDPPRAKRTDDPPRRKRATLFDYLSNEGLISR